jgi:hypothetical protein
LCWCVVTKGRNGDECMTVKHPQHAVHFPAHIATNSNATTTTPLSN